MKESAIYILTGLFTGLSVYSLTGWFFTRRTAASRGYAVRFIMFFLALLTVLIIFK